MPVVTIRLPEDLNEEIEGRLDYGDNKSEWFRQAAREKLDRDAETGDGSEGQEAPADA